MVSATRDEVRYRPKEGVMKGERGLSKAVPVPPTHPPTLKERPHPPPLEKLINE